MFEELSRRERHIMTVLFRLGEATAAAVAGELGGSDLHDTVRVTLRGLERKGVVKHRRDGNRHVYRPAQSPARAARTAARDLLDTFFNDAPAQAILTLLDAAERKLTAAELEQIRAQIDAARRERES